MHFLFLLLLCFACGTTSARRFASPKSAVATTTTTTTTTTNTTAHAPVVVRSAEDEKCVQSRFAPHHRRSFSYVRIPRTGSTFLHDLLMVNWRHHYGLVQSRATINDCLFCTTNGTIDTTTTHCVARTNQTASSSKNMLNVSCAADQARRTRLHTLMQERKPTAERREPIWPYDIHPIIEQHVPFEPASLGLYVPPHTPVFVEFREPRRRLFSAFVQRFWYGPAIPGNVSVCHKARLLQIKEVGEYVSYCGDAVDNQYCRWLSPAEPTVARALQVLNMPNVYVGLTEHLNETMELWSRVMCDTHRFTLQKQVHARKMAEAGHPERFHTLVNDFHLNGDAAVHVLAEQRYNASTEATLASMLRNDYTIYKVAQQKFQQQCQRFGVRLLNKIQ